MGGFVVSDTGPLISLEKVDGGLRLLRLMTDRVLIPEAVLLGAGAKLSDPASYLTVYGIADIAEVVRGVDVARVTSMPSRRRRPCPRARRGTGRGIRPRCPA